MSQTFSVENPFDNTLLGEYHFASWAQTQSAIAQLKAGQATQRRFTACHRAEVLAKLAELMRQHSEQLAMLITRETGKTIADSRVEIDRAINTTVASAEECRQISGETLDSDAYSPARGRLGVVVWRPLGTVLCITPFNFPINIAMHKVGPAFAAGNCVMLKPSPQNIASSQLLVQLCYQAGVPEDVLQLCLPDIADMAALIGHDDINAVNFTGGTAAAKSIADAAGYKKLLLELGGNDPLIVMPDGDIAAAVQAAINQRFATAGQRCTAAKRIFVHAEVYEVFRDTLVQAASQLKVGDPSQDDTFIGPVINDAAATLVKQRIDQAVAQGAEVLLGGQREGNIIYPTILQNVADGSALMVEETFGPVMPLRSFTDLDDIIAVINNTEYGLQAGVFTHDMRVIQRLFAELDVGTLATNDGPGFRAEHFPFGGVKQSGIGREGVKYAIREMSYLKTLVL